MQRILVGCNEINNKSQTKADDSGIKNIGKGSADTGEKPVPLPFIQCSLHAKQTDGSHRGGYNDPDENALIDYIDYVEHRREL